MVIMNSKEQEKMFTNVLSLEAACVERCMLGLCQWICICYGNAGKVQPKRNLALTFLDFLSLQLRSKTQRKKMFTSNKMPK